MCEDGARIPRVLLLLAVIVDEELAVVAERKKGWDRKARRREERSFGKKGGRDGASGNVREELASRGEILPRVRERGRGGEEEEHAPAGSANGGAGADGVTGRAARCADRHPLDYVCSYRRSRGSPRSDSRVEEARRPPCVSRVTRAVSLR